MFSCDEYEELNNNYETIGMAIMVMILKLQRLSGCNKISLNLCYRFYAKRPVISMITGLILLPFYLINVLWLIVKLNRFYFAALD